MNALKAAARNLKRSTPSESKSSDPVLYSPRCGRCTNIVLYFSGGPAEKDFLLHQTLSGTVGRFQVIDGSDKILDNGIAQGCFFCRMIKDHQDVSAKFDALGESPHLIAMFQRDNYLSCTVVADTNVSLEVWGRFCVQALATKTGDFVLSVNRDDPIAPIMTKRPPMSFLGCDEVFYTANHWIRHCLKYHGKSCSTAAGYSTTTLLPKRIIDLVGTAQDIRVTQTVEGSVGIYVALSYCWGVKPQVVLTSEAAADGDCDFPMITLPPTIKDAVTICRRLGYRYLWVDALCIIQDSPNAQDWIEQSAKMDEIYGNATLTIAAASGGSVWDGILKPTTEVPQLRCSIPFQGPEKVRQTENVLSFQHIPGSKVGVRFYPYNIDANQPLFHRAWTFQEEALSARILKFHKEQIVWHCNSKKIYLDGPVNVEQIQLFATWEEVIVEYTKRSMTFEEDRLMALAGYARAKQKEFDAGGIVNRYLGGIWEKELIDHLLWISKVKPAPPRPKAYRAPTWSWASINGPVEYVAPERKGNRNAYFDLLSVFLSTNPINPFGTLAKDPLSYLYIKAYVKPVPELEIPCQNKLMPINRDFRRGIGKHWWIEFDVINVRERMELGFRSQETLYCVRVTEFTALLLVAVASIEGTQCFERVGIVRHWQRAKWTWFDEVEGKTELYLT